MARDIWYILDNDKIYINRGENFYACYPNKVSELMIDSFQKAQLWIE